MIAPDDRIPPDDLARTVAHTCDTVTSALGHAVSHAGAARDAPTAESRAFNVRHLHAHADLAHKHARKFLAILAAWRPDVAEQLAKLDDATALAGRSVPGIPDPDDDVPKADRAATVAHLAGTVAVDLGHVELHSGRAAETAADHESFTFHIEHVLSHLDGALSHERKVVSVLAAYYKDVAAELASIDSLTSLGSRAPVASRSMALGERCDGCGGWTGGSVCVECGRSARGSAYEIAREDQRARFAAEAGSRWEHNRWN